MYANPSLPIQQQLTTRGLSQASHLAFRSLSSLTLVRGSNLSVLSITREELKRPKPSAAYLIHTDEEMYPLSIIACMPAPFHRELNLVDATTLAVKASTPITDDSIIEIHRDAVLTSNRFYTQITQLQITPYGLRQMAFRSLENRRSTTLFMLSITPEAKLVNLTGRSCLTLVDFRDGISHLVRQHQSCVTGIKAACRACFWDVEGTTSYLENGMIRRGVTVATREWRDAYAISDTSPLVALVDSDVFNLKTTRIFDVKRESVVLSIDEAVSPLFIDGIPQWTSVVNSEIAIVV